MKCLSYVNVFCLDSYSCVFFFLLNALFSAATSSEITAMTIKIPNMPRPITSQDFINKFTSMKLLIDHASSLLNQKDAFDQADNQASGNNGCNLSGYIYAGCMHQQEILRIFF